MQKLTAVFILLFFWGCESYDNVEISPLSTPSTIQNSGNSCGNNEFTVNIKFYNIKAPSNSNTGYSSSEITNAINTLNNNFSVHGISFQSTVEDLVTSYYSATAPEYNPFYFPVGPYWRDLMVNNDSPDFIEIFLFPSNAGFPGYHLDLNAGETAFAVGGSLAGEQIINTNVITHEMGNLFGLIDRGANDCNGPCCVTTNGVQVGNYMFDGAGFACLDEFDIGQEQEIFSNLHANPLYENLLTECCSNSHWELANTPNGTIAMGAPVDYQLKEVGSPNIIAPNSSVTIRVHAICPLNVRFNNTAHGISRNSYRDFTFNITDECSLNPSVSLPTMQFYALTSFGNQTLCTSAELMVEVELISVEQGHTFDASNHTFTIN